MLPVSIRSDVVGSFSGASRPSTKDGQVSPVESGSEAVINRNTRRIGDSAQLSRSEGGEIRGDLVARVRAQIAAGEYDSPAKIEAAAERLAGCLDLQA